MFQYMQRTAIVFLILLVNSTAALAAVPMVDNPREAPLTRTVVYEEVWRAGADEDAEYLFGVIMDVVEDDNGNIYLLDSQQQQVFKFSAQGDYLGLVSRRGQGPGEIENVYQMGYLGDGRLGFLKVVPSSLVVVDTLGIPLPGLTFDVATAEEEVAFGGLYSFAGHGMNYYGNGQLHLRDSFRGKTLSFVASFDGDGKEIHRFGEWYGGYDFSKPIKVDELASYHPLAVWEADDSGRIFHTVARDSYRIDIRNPDGSLVGRLGRSCSLHRRTAAEKQAVKKQYSFSSNVELPPISYNIADLDPAIAGIKIVGDELWIFSPQATRQGQGETAMIVDVFDLTGHLLENRTIVCPRDPQEDAVHYLTGGRIVRVKHLQSAMVSANPNRSVQHGDELKQAGDHADEAVLEVIVYRPVGQ